MKLHYPCGMTFETYFIAALAVVLTGISKSGFAGGLGILGVPLVALSMSPQAAAVLLLPILVGIDILTVWRYRDACQVHTIAALMPGALFGILLGMFSFAQINSDILRIAIGIMALSFATSHVLRAVNRPPPRQRVGRFAVFAASALSGFAGFVAHAGGPPIKGTLLRLNLDKSSFVGTNAVFFFLLNVTKGVGYGALGLFSTSGLLMSALLTPFLLLGVWLGFALHERIPQRTFTNLAYALLALAGMNLVILGVYSVWPTV